MRIDLPDPSLVVLIGASGSGKSSFAREHFKATEVISSDFCRGLVVDDENDQARNGGRIRGRSTSSLDDAWRNHASPSSTRRMFSARHASRSSSWPSNTTSSRWPSCSTCPSRSAENVTAHDLIGTSQLHVVRQQRSQLHRSTKGAAARGLSTSVGSALSRGGGECRGTSRSAVDRPAVRARAVRHHRRRSRLLRRAGGFAARARLRHCRRGRRQQSLPRMGVERCSSATMATVARTRRAC